MVCIMALRNSLNKVCCTDGLYGGVTETVSIKFCGTDGLNDGVLDDALLALLESP